MLDNWRVWLAVSAAALFRFLKSSSPRPLWHRFTSTAASAGAAVALWPFALEMTGLTHYDTAAPAVAAAIVLIAETIADRLLTVRSFSELTKVLKGKEPPNDGI